MKKILLCTSLILITSLLSFEVASQINLEKKAKNATIRRADTRTDQGINKGLDAVENGIKGAFKKDKEDPKKEKEKEKSDPKAEKKVDTKEPATAKQQEPALESYSKYDFVPGEKIILFDDFSQDAVGDFPALWTTNAPGEVNTLNIAPGHWLNLNSTDGNYFLLKSIDFPKNFIVEFDIVPKKTGGRIAAVLILYGESKPMEMDNNPNPGNSGIHISIEKEIWKTQGYKTGGNPNITGSSAVNPVEVEKVNHVIVWVQNRRVRIYHKSAKVLDMPTNIYDGTKLNRLCFRLSRGASAGAYISNVRITDAAPDMRSKLLTEGKLVTYGIYFDVNKDAVKPESYGTLKSIADVLKENADVKVKITGHTDGDGDAAKNLDLSKRRAVSVKNELVNNFGIDASRIETDGKGKTEPVAPNDTPANKAQNRRVEFIKL
jgi:outer membrane protein OmpA-like peptidoglycan-associated protein